jgi:hypothetical protein
VVGALLVLMLTVASGLVSAPVAGAAPGGSGIRVELVAVSPSAPTAADIVQAVSITAVLTNIGDTAFSRVRVVLDRGAPIVQRVLLHDALGAPPSTNLYAANQDPVQLPAPLAPGASASVAYVTTPEAMGLFINGVYPYDLVAQGAIGTGPFREAGRASLLVPSLYYPPSAPLSVSWIWPLIDIPHLSASDVLATKDAAFANDDLATSVRSGGRLDRALRVVEAVTPTVRMTLVIDPGLINELLLMSAGYTVPRSGGTAVAGTGGEAAKAWLARLKAIAAQHDLVLTGLGDPDLDSVAAAGLPHGGSLSAALAERVSAALGAPYRTDVVWPIDETLTPAAADAALQTGAAAILLRDTALTGGTRPDTATSPAGIAGEVRGLSDTALAPLTITGSAAAAGAAVVLDSSLRRRVVEATQANQIRVPGDLRGTEGASAQTAASRVQNLLGELAIWPLNNAASGGFVALAPARMVNPDSTAAAAAILATASTGWTRIVTVREAIQSAARIDRGGLAAAGAQSGLDPTLVSAVREADSQLAAAGQLLGPTAGTILASAQAALTLATSAAWRGNPEPGLAYAGAASDAAQAIVGGVSVVTPDNASYSLSSENSPLIITVRNDLDFAVNIKLLVTPATASVTGFSAEDVGVQVIEPGTARTLQVPAHFERSGRFEVVAQLTTETGAPLGDPVRLSVLCTAYGTVALSITVAAFVLLLLLLAFRGVRGLRRRHLAHAARGSE